MIKEHDRRKHSKRSTIGDQVDASETLRAGKDESAVAANGGETVSLRRDQGALPHPKDEVNADTLPADGRDRKSEVEDMESSSTDASASSMGASFAHCDEALPGGRLSQEITPGTDSSGLVHESSPAIERLSAIDRQEHRANLMRWRRVFTWGVVLWPGFAVVDLAVVGLMQQGTLAFLLGIRLALLPFYGLMLWRLYRPPDVSAGMLRGFDLIAFGSASAAISLMSTRLGGFESIYFGGIIVVIVCRGAFVVEPWKKGLVANALIVAAWIGVLMGSALFVPRLAAQLDDIRVMGAFLVQIGFVISVALLVVLGGHAFWALRRQVFEARNIGRYRLKKRIGKGGMGEVWSAWHAALRRDVAIKLLRPESSSDVAAVERFEREVAATAELSHPNTIRVFDYGVTEDGIWYYVMELLDGEDVKRLVERLGPLPQQRAAHIAHQTIRALAEAHQRGIVHRDVKPENIFVTSAGGESDIVKVLDFGIAKSTLGESDHALTRTGAVVGTPAYMSPEAARSTQTDSRSDIYSLGAVFYFMLTGHPPFEREGFTELLMAQINDHPAPIEDLLGRPIRPDLNRIVMRCLEKDPGDRYQDAVELADDLQACLVDLQASAKTVA